MGSYTNFQRRCGKTTSSFWSVNRWVSQFWPFLVQQEEEGIKLRCWCSLGSSWVMGQQSNRVGQKLSKFLQSATLTMYDGKLLWTTENTLFGGLFGLWYIQLWVLFPTKNCQTKLLHGEVRGQWSLCKHSSTTIASAVIWPLVREREAKEWMLGRSATHLSHSIGYISTLHKTPLQISCWKSK